MTKKNCPSSVTAEDINGSSSAIAAGSPAANKKGKKDKKDDKMPNSMNCKFARTKNPLSFETEFSRKHLAVLFNIKLIDPIGGEHIFVP